MVKIYVDDLTLAAAVDEINRYNHDQDRPG